MPLIIKHYLANTYMRRKPGLSFFAAILAVLVSSCKVGPDYETPKAKVAEQWSGNYVPVKQADSAAETLWWQSFEDAVLNQLIDKAYQNNLSLQIAGARILEARARLNQAIGNLFPQQQVITGDLNYTRLNDGLISKLPGIDPDHVTDQLLFAATWEIDFWGKYRRSIEAEEASYLGSVAAYEDALITLISDVAASYVNIRTLEERLVVAARNVETQKESLRIATVQFQAGETGERDVQQAMTQLAQTEAQIPRLEETLRQTKNGLAVLLGETPDQIDRFLMGPGQIPPPPSQVAAGIPRDLLRRRPDVRQAELAAASQSALIGVATAEMYPSFSLSGQLGASANNQGQNSLADIFNWSSRDLSAGAGFTFPIFNYGRLVNQVRVQDAQFQQAVLNYQNTVLVAQQEVENGLTSFSCQQRAVDLLTQAASAARRSTELAMLQYKEGQTDYTTVLTAEQAQLSVEDALASSRGGVVQGIISVYRALGGGWEIRQGHDVISDTTKAEMAERTPWGKLLEPSQHLPESTVEEDTTPAEEGQYQQANGSVKP